MRISDWSSDVCSSDLFTYLPVLSHEPESGAWAGERGFVHEMAHRHFGGDFRGHKAYLCGPPLMIEACISMIGRASCRERVGQYVYISVVYVSLKKKLLT